MVCDLEAEPFTHSCTVHRIQSITQITWGNYTDFCVRWIQTPASAVDGVKLLWIPLQTKHIWLS